MANTIITTSRTLTVGDLLAETDALLPAVAKILNKAVKEGELPAQGDATVGAAIAYHGLRLLFASAASVPEDIREVILSVLLQGAKESAHALVVLDADGQVYHGSGSETPN